MEYFELIKINENDDRVFEYATSLSSGIDLRVYIPNDTINMPAYSVAAIPTGLKIRLNPNYEAQVRSRSGLALKHNISVANSPGTVDADFDQEIKVILQCGGNGFTVNHGDRIAQLVVSPIVREKQYISSNVRNGGFGSTGV